MAPSKLSNPFAFTPGPVTFFCTVIYVALGVALLVVQLTVPKAPTQTPYAAVNLTEAWHDLQVLSDGFHPFNSRRNDEIYNWLLLRLNAILTDNNAAQTGLGSDAQQWGSSDANVTIFADRVSNLTSTSRTLDSPSIGTYFESKNIIVYIRGSEDEPGEWWKKRRLDGPSGTLINAHYDSVSTGFGATDDGMGVISVMQVIKHFTSEGNRPRHGIVALLNNGEEDFLNGARVFARHPVSRFPTAFLNLEGAGAGGRAAIFRSTDSEVTHAYRGTEHPCGTVVISDGFRRGLVRSETDYVVFNGDLGMRGIDVAFVEPRWRYHTTQDDARHSSVDALWHMLSAALHTMHGLTDDVWNTSEGSTGVWFDMLGDSFVNMELHVLFALSVTLLVVAPVTMIIIGSVLSGSDRLYVFRLTKQASGQKVRLRGLHGLSRALFVIGVPTVIVLALALLLVKVNPFIIESSPFAVWSMMLSVWIFTAWFLSKTADFARPSAFHRLYSYLWMFVIFWLLLVAVTIVEDTAEIASGYFVVWYFFGITMAVVIGFLELFALEKRKDYAERWVGDSDASLRRRESAARKDNRRISGASARLLSRPQAEDANEEEAVEEEATESTSLLRSPQRTTFANYATSVPESEDTSSVQPFDYEQNWSANLPSWTWLLQLLVATPITVILVGQVALDMTIGLDQTLADGSSPLVVYMLIAICAALLVMPLTPFLHRFTYHIPVFLLLVFIGTLVYNLVAFPFSAENRLKLYFIQEVNLDTGVNKVVISSTDNKFVADVVNSLPSRYGQSVQKDKGRKRDLFEFSWEGTPPQVVPNTHPGVPPELGYKDWVSFNATRKSINQAHFSVRGQNTRSCRIKFEKPISDFFVEGGDTDERFPSFSENGISEVRLWSREWDKTWEVTVTWPPVDPGEGDTDGDGQDGRVVCLWNEDHEGLIPALDEFRRFAPPWTIATKLDDGLVEGYKKFLV